MIDQQSYFTITELNTLIKSHKYGYSDTDTKPGPIERDRSSIHGFKIKQSGYSKQCKYNVLTYGDYEYTCAASQMMTLMKIFPFVVGRLIPEDDEHWQCFLLLWDICSMVLSFEFSTGESAC